MIASLHFRALIPLSLFAFFCFSPGVSAQSSADEESTLLSTPIQTAPTGTLTLGERLELERKLNFGPANFLVPAYEAGFRLEFPLHGEPPNWHEGVGGFARNYGADFALTTTAGFGRFTADAIMRHDPRYYPSSSSNAGRRFLHALAFTLADNTDTGHRSFAFGNFAGAAAAGGVSMAIYPHGFNDFVHADQRFNLQLANFAAHNLFAEFAPEAIRVAHALHIPERFASSLLPADRKQP